MSFECYITAVFARVASHVMFLRTNFVVTMRSAEMVVVVRDTPEDVCVQRVSMGNSARTISMNVRIW